LRAGHLLCREQTHHISKTATTTLARISNACSSMKMPRGCLSSQLLGSIVRAERRSYALGSHLVVIWQNATTGESITLTCACPPFRALNEIFTAKIARYMSEVGSRRHRPKWSSPRLLVSALPLNPFVKPEGDDPAEMAPRNHQPKSLELWLTASKTLAETITKSTSKDIRSLYMLSHDRHPMRAVKQVLYMYLWQVTLNI
jgi:hypothetical protein